MSGEEIWCEGVVKRDVMWNGSERGGSGEEWGEH